MSHFRELFIDAYIEAIYFTETGDTDQPDSSIDLSAESRADIETECVKFLNLYQPFLGDNAQQAGHDFWLTRNGHGAGFWDRPEIYGERIASALSELVGFGTPFPEQYAYEDDDGFLRVV